MTAFNVAEINVCTETEGPGKRLSIWFQGCNIGCAGCSNASLQPIVPRHVMSLDSIMSVVTTSKEKYGIEGVTYLGGEPTLQRSLPELTAGIKATGLGVIAYTGRQFEDVKDSLIGCDLVVDGPFVESLRSNTRRIIGSDNQRIICITDRYKAQIDWFNNDKMLTGEFNVSEMGIVFNGSPI